MISRRSWLAELAVSGSVLLGLIGVGVWNGYPASTTLPPLAGYLGWHLYQLYRFSRWLERPKQRAQPYPIGLWRHITESTSELRERSRKHKRRLRSILDGFQESTDALPDATIVIDDNNRIEWWNATTTSLLGITLKVARTQRIDGIITDPVFRRCLNEHDYTKPLQVPAPRDDSTALEVRIVPYGKGKRLVQARDITRLQQLETVRRDFVANVSHEIRTPLTVVHGYLEMLCSSPDAVLGPWQSLFVQMHRQSLRMQRIIEDLLLLARLETGSDNENGQSVDIPPLLSAICEEAKLLSGDLCHSIQLETAPGLNLHGNAAELYSAFSNLVSNAVRYTPAGGKIRIRWSMAGEQPCFSVTDTGIGIDQSHLPRLTERFYRVDVGRSRQTGGTGLGLAIVKHALNRHGGVLTIDSDPDKGSTFCCRFPTSRAVFTPTGAE
jgi:two-component system phosphate regulon sensor histidine kinase PhoR